jgi:hypothetical protein
MLVRTRRDFSVPAAPVFSGRTPNHKFAYCGLRSSRTRPAAHGTLAPMRFRRTLKFFRTIVLHARAITSTNHRQPASQRRCSTFCVIDKNIDFRPTTGAYFIM